MTRRARLWRVVGVLFVLANVGGAVVALAERELAHATVHVALAAGAVFLMSRRRGAREAAVPALEPLDDRLARIENAVDAVAIEVERIGEAQRFQDKLRAEPVSQGERAPVRGS